MTRPRLMTRKPTRNRAICPAATTTTDIDTKQQTHETQVTPSSEEHLVVGHSSRQTVSYSEFDLLCRRGPHTHRYFLLLALDVVSPPRTASENAGSPGRLLPDKNCRPYSNENEALQEGMKIVVFVISTCK
ncbi:hypothetical protein ScPMuIL_003784 [Solemya velum]